MFCEVIPHVLIFLFQSTTRSIFKTCPSSNKIAYPLFWTFFLTVSEMMPSATDLSVLIEVGG